MAASPSEPQVLINNKSGQHTFTVSTSHNLGTGYSQTYPDTAICTIVPSGDVIVITEQLNNGSAGIVYVHHANGTIDGISHLGPRAMFCSGEWINMSAIPCAKCTLQKKPCTCSTDALETGVYTYTLDTTTYLEWSHRTCTITFITTDKDTRI